MKTSFLTKRERSTGWLTHLLLPCVTMFAAVNLHAASNAQPLEYITLGGQQVHPTHILAKFKGENQSAAATTAITMAEAIVVHRYSRLPQLVVLEDSAATANSSDENALRLRLQQRIQALQDSGQFEYVEPDYILHADATPTDSAFVDGTLWGLRNYGQSAGLAGADISATNAWDITTGSTNVIVAVIDTGIRYTHRDLTNQMWRNPGEIPGNGIDDDGNGLVDDVYGINAAAGTGDPFDDNDHGTHCAGTIGAAANDSNPHVGVAWHVRLMACKFLRASGSGATSDAIACVDYAVSKGAKILNNSWGGGAFSKALFDSINNASQAGVLFVAAAGNSGVDNDAFPHYPANYLSPNIISVAALDRNDQLANFSDYGLTTVHLGAPGVAIFSSTAGSDTEYQLFDGTSMATPHVSGVAALILSQFPGADLSELKARLLLGTVPVPALAGKCTTGGRVNAYRSLTLSGSGVLQLSVTPPSTSVLLASSTQPIYVKVTDLFGVQNATVTATITGAVNTNLTFLDNGLTADKLAGDAIYSANFSVPASTGSVTMTIVATATNKVSATNILTYTFVPPPPNDYFTNALKIPVGGATYLSNNRFATMESGEPKHAGITNVAGSLWWTWTPTATTNGFVDTTGSTVDTLIAVYTGNTLGSLTQVVATNDVGSKKQAYVGFSATNGVTYRIAIASVSTNDLGSLQVRLAPGGQPDTTPPTVAVVSPLSGVTVTSNLVTITGTASDPAPNVSGLSEVVLSVNGAIAYTATGTTNWSSIALLSPGINSIVVQAYDAARNLSAPVTIQINYFVNDPINDFFVNRSILTGTSGQSDIYTTNATKEVGEPNHAGNGGGKSAWWSFQAPADGMLSLSTTNSNFDTLLAVYTGNSVGALTPIAANDDALAGGLGGISALSTAVRAGSAYAIAVDGFDAASGHARLTYQFTAAPVFRLTINGTTGGTTQPGSMDVVSNQTVSVTALPAAGYGFSSWQGDVVSLANPLAVLVKSDRSITPQFAPVSFSDGFESGNFTGLIWSTSGNAPWTVQTNTVAAGLFAARSGVIGNSQVSSLFLQGNYRAGAASFAVRVSSEPTWDLLAFYIDGLLAQQWSGDVAWTTYNFPITAGAHSMEWRYSKDGSDSVGLDAAFIDNLNLPMLVAFTTNTPARLSIHRQTDGMAYIDLLGQTNQLYILQSSANLQTWQPISTNILFSGFEHILDPASLTNGTRFYRAVAPAP